jgi:hypothetical protein
MMPETVPVRKLLTLALLFAAGGFAARFNAAPAAEPAGVTIQVSEDHISFRSGEALIGSYHIGRDVAKPYLWPVHGPAGVPMTRSWPMVKGQPGESTDHPHQKSVWFCHGDVIPEGIPLKQKVRGVEGVDFWSEAKGHGVIRCWKVGDVKGDKKHASIATLNTWSTADDQRILDETRTIYLYDLGDARLFVFDIDLHASVCPVTFGDTKEGAFGIRINDRITEEKRDGKKVGKGDGKIENADGKVGEKNCWGQVSAWCDYSGPIAKHTAGLAIFSDPQHRYPACWHSRGYGLMAANPFGRAKSGFPAMKGHSDLVKLAKGEHLKLRYGLLIHPGDAKSGKVAEHYERFVKLGQEAQKE